MQNAFYTGEAVSVFLSIKRLFKNSAIYGIGHILSRFINFLLLPLYTHVLTREEYGMVGIFFTYIAILSILYTYGLSSAFFRFYLAKEEKSERDRVFSTAFFALLITSGLFSALLILFANPLSQILFSGSIQNGTVSVPFVVRMAAVILFFDAIGLLGFLVLLSKEKSVLYAVLKLLFVLMNVGCNILLVVVLKMGVEGIFMANAIASCFCMLSVLPVMLKHLRKMFSPALFQELLAFGLPYIMVNASVIVMDTIDRPLLKRLASIEEAGLFNAGVKLGMFMAIFVSAFRFAWFPFFMSHAKVENAKVTFSRVLTYVLLACLSVFLLISFYIDPIVRFDFFGYSIIGSEFWDSAVVAPVVMLAYIFYAVYINFLIGIYLKKKTIYLSYITGAGMLGNILLNILLIPSIGMMGASWARLGAYLIMAVSVYFVSRRLYPIAYEWRRLIKLIFLVGAVFFLGIRAPVRFRFLCILALPVCLWLVRFWHPQEIQKVKQGLTGLLKIRFRSR
ncbi:oligosaccharide flippase family protein [bacterium]|nr:oligosaccharide flippase family protein [bacterium]